MKFVSERIGMPKSCRSKMGQLEILHASNGVIPRDLLRLSGVLTKETQNSN
jgi:hypothetical protein